MIWKVYNLSKNNESLFRMQNRFLLHSEEALHDYMGSFYNPNYFRLL